MAEAVATGVCTPLLSRASTFSALHVPTGASPAKFVKRSREGEIHAAGRLAVPSDPADAVTVEGADEVSSRYAVIALLPAGTVAELTAFAQALSLKKRALEEVELNATVVA